MRSLDNCDIHGMSEVKEFVVLVDEQDNVLGTMEKMEAHKRDIYIRAISVLLFDKDHRMLLQKRASTRSIIGPTYGVMPYAAIKTQ